MAYIEDDELVEVTPNSIRLRKKVLDPDDRKRERAAQGSRARLTRVRFDTARSRCRDGVRRRRAKIVFPVLTLAMRTHSAMENVVRPWRSCNSRVADHEQAWLFAPSGDGGRPRFRY